MKKLIIILLSSTFIVYYSSSSAGTVVISNKSKKYSVVVGKNGADVALRKGDVFAKHRFSIFEYLDNIFNQEKNKND